MVIEESVSQIPFILLRQMFIDTIPEKVLNIVNNLLTEDDIYHSTMRNNSNVTRIKYDPKFKQVYTVIGIVIKELSARNAVSTNDMWKI